MADQWIVGIVPPLPQDQVAPPSELALMQAMIVDQNQLPAQEVTLQAILTATTNGGKAETVWTDDTNAFFIRIDNGVAITWATPTGGVSTGPGSGARPAAGASIVVDSSRYQATIAGTGYVIGDYLSHIVTTDPTTGIILAYFWLNVTQNTKLAASPVSANITPISPLPAGAALSANQASLLTTALGTAVRTTTVDPITGNAALVQAFHNADNQVIGATSYGVMTGGVAQIVNAAGNLDRQREVWGDAQPITGIQSGMGMLWNGATYDRSRSASVDAQPVTGLAAEIPYIFNGTTYDRVRSVSGDAMGLVGIEASADMLWNGATYDRPRSVAGDAMAATGLPAEVAMLYNGATYDRLYGTTNAAWVTLKTALPAGSNAIGTVALTAGAAAIGSITNTTFAATQSGTWNVGSITSLPALATGSNTVGNVNQSLATAGFSKITDGTNTLAVKAASTAPTATDPALVTTPSPNAASPQSIGAANIAASQATVGTSAALLVAARTGAVGTGRVAVTVSNNGSAIIYIGASGVTTSTGKSIPPGNSFTLKTTAAIYAISGTAAQAVDYVETY